MPGFDHHQMAGDIEIVPYSEGYLKDGKFDLQWVINGWQEKLAQALAKGYAGIRVNGNEAGLTEKDWKDFAAYEVKFNGLIANQQFWLLTNKLFCANILTV